MGRRRLGVVLLLDGPVAAEVDVLRRAVGDPALGRIPAHCTLVPPVGIKEDALPQALEVVARGALAETGPLVLDLGPPTSFLPDNPVLILAVGGPGVRGLHSLRQRVFDGAWKRSARWPFVPHVTLHDDMDEDLIAPAARTLGSWTATAEVRRVHVLQQGPGPDKVWAPIPEAPDGYPMAR